MDISSCGRQLAPGSPESKARAISRAIDAMARLDTERAKEYHDMVRSDSTGPNTLTGNRYFWRSDYLVHRRPDFCATLKMSSTRTIGTESINSENLSGYYLADGALYLYRAGDEYRDIFPLWNWRKLPGVTCPQKEGPPPTFTGGPRGASTFAGGVSDGSNGCAVLDYRRDGVAVKKAWFFAGDLIVCLGAGIQGEEKMADPIATTVNQCLLRGPVRVCAGNTERMLEAGITRFEDLSWIEHDGVRYTFPDIQTVMVSNLPQTGSWSKVLQNSTTPKEDVTKGGFRLQIEHGAHPAVSRCAYLIQLIPATRQTDVTILANTPQLQAAGTADLVMAVFHVAGTLQYTENNVLSVSQPCLVMLDIAKKKAYVADPTQKLITLTLTLNGKAYDVALPQGGEKGSTQVVELK